MKAIVNTTLENGSDFEGQRKFEKWIVVFEPGDFFPLIEEEKIEELKIS